MNRYFIKNFPYYLTAPGAIGVLALFAWMGNYAHPAADDFCMAVGVRNEGLWQHLLNHYLQWSGRYTGNALYAIYPLIFGMFDGLHFMPLILIVSLLLAMVYLLSTFFRLSFFNPWLWLTTLLFVMLYLLGIKHSASSLYWPAGALTYFSANILFVVLLALLIQLHDRQQNRQGYTVVLAASLVVVFLAMGCNEIALIVVAALVSFSLLFHRKSAYKPWLAVFVMMLAGFCLLYFSPGNAIRESTFPLRHNLSVALAGSFKMGIWVLKSWLSEPLFWIGSLWMVLLLYLLLKNSHRKLKISAKSLFALFVLTFILPFVLQFPAWWAMGGWPPPRTVDAIYFFFLFAWLFALSSVRLFFSEQIEAFLQKRSRITLWIGSIVLSVLLLAAVDSNFKFIRLQIDLSERAEPFNAYMQQRYVLIEQALQQGQLFLSVPAYEGKYPKSIYFNDIVSKPWDWRNRCYAGYFGLRQIARISKIHKKR